MDKVSDTLVEAFKQGMSHPGEIRLFRSGKLPGLFAGRSSLNADAANMALDDGLLELVRTETKGKSTIQWVRITQAGIDFLLNYESPVRVLEELRHTLQTAKDSVPDWFGDLRQTLRRLDHRLNNELENMSRRLDGLQVRVTAALERIEQNTLKVPAATSATVPWAQEALTYIDRRRNGGVDNNCPLPELFAELRRQQSTLTVSEFHVGLKRLQNRGLLRLLPFDEGNEIPEPEFALLEGTEVFYFVAQ